MPPYHRPISALTITLRASFVSITFSCSVALAQNTLWETYVEAGNKSYNLGQFKDAERLYRAALRSAEDSEPADARLATAFDRLAEIVLTEGKYAEAETLYKRSLSIWENLGGAQSPEVASVLANLGAVYQHEKQHVEAQALMRRALAIREKRFGEESTEVASSLNDLAELLIEQKKSEEAAPLCKRALTIREKLLGPRHPGVARSLHNLGMIYSTTATTYDEAEDCYLRALKIREESQESWKPEKWVILFNLGNLYKRKAVAFANQRDAIQADAFLSKAAEHYQNAIEAKVNLHNAYEVLADLLRKLDRKADLERYCDQEIGVNPEIANPYYYKGWLRQEEGKYAEALEMYQKALNPRGLRLDADIAQNAAMGAGVCLMKLERWTDAIRYLEKSAEKFPRKYEVRMNLGFCYLKLDRLEQAEIQYREAAKLRNDGTAQGYLDEIERRKQGNP